MHHGGNKVAPSPRAQLPVAQLPVPVPVPVPQSEFTSSSHNLNNSPGTLADGTDSVKYTPANSSSIFSDEYSMFLFIKDSSLSSQYHSQRARTTSPLSLLILAVFFIGIIATKGNLHNFFRDNTYWGLFHVAILIYIPLCIATFLYKTIMRQPLVFFSTWGVNLSVVLSSTLVSLLLAARNMTGPCDAAVTALWDLQSCNPSAPHALPIESHLQYIVPLLAQILSPGANWNAVLTSHVIALATLISQSVKLSLLEMPYLVCYYALTLACSYEIERQRIETFLLTVHTEKRAEKLEEIKNHEREKKMGAWKVVLCCVAHDLQSPMQSILMDIAWLIKEMRAKSSQFVEFLDTAEQVQLAGQFMSTGIRRALDFIKTESHVALVPSVTSFDVNEAAGQAIRWISALKTETFTLHLAPLPPSMCPVVFSDREWMVDNVLCLLSNAVKYSTKHSTVTVSIEIVTADASRSGASECQHTATLSENTIPMILVSVQDNGIGVPEELRAQLFQPFTTGQSMVGGTGIGLYSLSRRVASLRGTYGIRSRDDGQCGSVFYFSVPYRADQFESTNSQAVRDGEHSTSAVVPTLIPADFPAKEPSASLFAKNHDISKVLSPVPVPMSQPAKRRPCVLLVDDSTVVLKAVERALERSGYNVVVAENGEEGLREYFLTPEPRFDLILSDVQMPVMDGIEFRKRLKALADVEAQRKVIFGFMSANSSDDVRSKLLDCNVDFILEKPFSMTKFNENVHMLLQK